MFFGVEFDAREHRAELLREAEERRLARGLEDARSTRVRRPEIRDGTDEGGSGMTVRWGLHADDERVAELLELNGMPRWVAFEERFVIAEESGKIVGALRYRTESKRLLLGLLVVDPWAGERRTAKMLYEGSQELARDLGANEVVAEVTGTDYPRAAGYHRFGRGWVSTVPRSGEDGVSGGGWRRLLRLWGAMAVPFHRAFR